MKGPHHGNTAMQACRYPFSKSFIQTWTLVPADLRFKERSFRLDRRAQSARLIPVTHDKPPNVDVARARSRRATRRDRDVPAGTRPTHASTPGDDRPGPPGDQLGKVVRRSARPWMFCYDESDPWPEGDGLLFDSATSVRERRGIWQERALRQGPDLVTIAPRRTSRPSAGDLRGVGRDLESLIAGVRFIF